LPEQGDRSGRARWRDVFRGRRGRTIAGARRRRILLRVGIALLAVTIFVIVPGYVASRPAFMKHYANYEAAYETWSTSVHVKVACQQCHVPPRATSQVVHEARMVGEFYLSAVFRSRQPKLLSTPTNEACRNCHPDWRTVSPTGDLNIPHRAHVVVLKMECVTCHAYLVHEKSPEGKHVPRMEACLTCHDGKTAKNACATCHTSKAAPVSHRAADWLVVHPQKQSEIDCAKCHGWTQHWCSECHSRRPISHGADWRATHRLAVKAHRNCEACHEAAFCVKCHGEVPKLNFDPALKLVRQ
jgi:hypothetical protein